MILEVLNRIFVNFRLPIISGLLSVVVGTFISWTIGKAFKVELPPVCDSWNKNFVMELSLFFTGMISTFGLLTLNKFGFV